ncbi:MAG: DUF4942 domain-containing protein [Oscillospiraceae bacterium]|nr:DUF4942 domain-containing protein [Oscillospiraceae bacterium]MCL2277887.1 DUF4942 domain-containing protein [Oscillospiraceae bacterium]
MTKITNVITEGDNQFYPTPNHIADKMLEGIDWNEVKSVLEPSAGKGDLALAVIRSFASANNSRSFSSCRQVDVDCIEIDPYLRAVLKEGFYNSEITKPLREHRDKLQNQLYESDDGAIRNMLFEVDREINNIERGLVNIIHDDFLTYHCHKDYQLIIMNPPFSSGDRHLLKALELQKDGGAVICLLNAETLRNPYTKSRQLLKRELYRLDAETVFIDDAFADAERKADVDVVIVRINIPYCAEKHSDIWERMEKAAKEEPQEDFEATGLIAGDYIAQAVMRFNTEVAASKELIRQYKALAPYIMEKLDPNASHNKAILTLTVGNDSNFLQIVDMDKYMKAVRLKYWNALFRNKKFMGKLTSKLSDDYIKKIEKMADYDFTLFNINTVMCDMDAQVVDGIKSAIISCFDKLTAEHTHYPECKQTIHYYNGWKTNKAHKIVKKSIIPTYGMFSSYSWSNSTFEVSTAFGVLSDIEKIFDYLSGNPSDDSDIMERLQLSDKSGKTKNIPLKYFDVDLYKKGTTHIKYRDMELVDKLNIYAARNKNWLPPNYGKAPYSEMTHEEKTVVDDFQGETAYNNIFARSDFFLAEPTNTITMLSEVA